MLEVEGLTRSYRGHPALQGVSFRVARGEVVGLLGPNGAGKSTLLQILTGWLAPSAGVARVCGFDVLDAPREVARRIGSLPENAPLWPEMTPAAVLDFAARAHRLGPSERARAIARVADETAIADRLHLPIGTLSRGYRQRVGLAVALVHGPELLLLDEPTTGLDPNQIVEIRALVRRLGRSRTVLLSSHALAEVQATCDRVVILHRGRVVADGPVDAVTAQVGGRSLWVGIGAGKVLRTDAELAASLAAIPGVRGVRAAAPADGARRFELEVTGEVRPAIWRWSVDQGQVLVELTAANRSLEDVFRALTEAA